jgi:amino acid transporter
MIYACLCTNVVTLGMVEWAFQSSFPKGNLLYSILISGVWVSFLVIAYTGLVVTIPRAGGDYVWQSRILFSGPGFVMAATGWWFIMWLWAPIYGTVLSEEFFQPLWATTGHASQAAWFATHNGIFVVTLITIVLAGVLVSIGMAGYARVQKWCFYGGLVGFAIIVIILLITSKASFISSFNSRALQLFGAGHSYQATNAAAVKSGYIAPTFGGGTFGVSMLLVPLMMFYLMWPNWSTALYGEIRGASDFRRVFSGMFIGLWTTVALSIAFLLLFAMTFGWSFYLNVNEQWSGLGKAALPIFPYPVMLASWVVHNTVFQFILILIMSLWFFGWVGTLFLSSTRVIFAAAFDRVLPDAATQVSGKRRAPFPSLVLMLLPAVGLGALYAYNTTFAQYTLDGVLVSAVTYLFSGIAVVILPLRKPDLWYASPASKVKLFGVPVVPVAGMITIALLVYNLYEWLSNGTYGVNHKGSLVYMGAMYVLAVVVYVGARIIRNRQGIDLGLINKEIPVE